ncbi:MAG: ABC transporter ATP-binding protein [Rhodobacteraceae bacterium]|nr:ABC transporter ATP-binding protein [Paracoccaceae bacterium]
MADVNFCRVVKRFGEVSVLRDVDIEIKSGEFVVIVGPSGCGKSTLLRILAGLEEPTGGRILIDGQDMDGRSPGERGIAMVFQSYALYPHKTVAENIAFPLRMAGADKNEIASKVRTAAQILQIEPLLDRKPRQLSGGQKQRVAIGRAIVRQPRVFLFDEPLSNLDADLRSQMRAEIVRLHRLLGTTMLYVTHDQVEAMTMADRIVVMNGGVVQQVGEPLELFESPANQFIASFIGSPKINLVDCIVRTEGSKVSLDLGDEALRICLPGLQPGGKLPARIGIRPDSVALEAIPDTYIKFPFTVERTEFLGSRTRYFGSLAARVPFAIDVPGTPGTLDGQRHEIGIDLARVYLFDAAGQTISASAPPRAVSAGPIESCSNSKGRDDAS